MFVQIAQRRAVVSSRFVAKAAPGPLAEPLPQDDDVVMASNADMASEALFRAEAERDLDEEEELFNLE